MSHFLLPGLGKTYAWALPSITRRTLCPAPPTRITSQGCSASRVWLMSLLPCARVVAMISLSRGAFVRLIPNAPNPTIAHIVSAGRVRLVLVVFKRLTDNSCHSLSVHRNSNQHSDMVQKALCVLRRPRPVDPPTRRSDPRRPMSTLLDTRASERLHLKAL